MQANRSQPYYHYQNVRRRSHLIHPNTGRNIPLLTCTYTSPRRTALRLRDADRAPRLLLLRP